MEASRSPSPNLPLSANSQPSMHPNPVGSNGTALLSWAATLWAFTPGSLDEARLKVASIYYDRLILPVEEGLLQTILNQFRSESPKLHKLSDAWISLEKACPNLDTKQILRSVFDADPLTWSSDGNLNPVLAEHVDTAILETLQMAPDQLASFKSQDSGYGYKKEANAIAVSSTSNARTWAAIRQECPCSLAAFYDLELAAARLLLDDSSSTAVPSIYDQVELHVPTVRNLCWEALIDLRSDPRVSNFRRWLSTPVFIRSKEDAYRFAIDELWQAVADLKTTVTSESIKAVFSNLPLPIPVNPIGIALSAKSVHAARCFDKRHGWLVFLHRMRSSISCGEEPSTA